MTKKPVLTAEREKVQDISKVFDEQIYKNSSLSNPSPYALTATDSSSATDKLTAEPLNSATTTADKPRKVDRSKVGLAITPYPQVAPKDSKRSKDKDKPSADELLTNPRLEKGMSSNKWESIKTIALITAMVAGINAISITLGYINGEISGLGSIVGSGIMFFVLFIIVLLSWFSMIFVRKVPVKSYYSRMRDESIERISRTSSLNNKNTEY